MIHNFKQFIQPPTPSILSTAFQPMECLAYIQTPPGMRQSWFAEARYATFGDFACNKSLTLSRNQSDTASSHCACSTLLGSHSLPALLSSVFFTFSYECMEQIHKLYILCYYNPSPLLSLQWSRDPTKFHVLASPQVQGSVTNPHFLNFPGGRKLTFDKSCDVPGI